jgi:hypothetical protein
MILDTCQEWAKSLLSHFSDINSFKIPLEVLILTQENALLIR